MKKVKILFIVVLTFFITGTGYLFNINSIDSYSNNYLSDPTGVNATTFSFLNYLFVEDYDLEPEFNKYNYEYTVKVASGTDKLNITYRPLSKNSTGEIIGNENLKNGSKVIVRIYTMDKKTYSDYTLNVVYSNSKVVYIILMILLGLVVVGAIIGLILYILVKKGVLTLRVKQKDEIGKENYVK